MLTNVPQTKPATRPTAKEVEDMCTAERRDSGKR